MHTKWVFAVLAFSTVGCFQAPKGSHWAFRAPDRSASNDRRVASASNGALPAVVKPPSATPTTGLVRVDAQRGTAMGLFGPAPGGAISLWPLPLPTAPTQASGAAPAWPTLSLDPRAFPLRQSFGLPALSGLPNLGPLASPAQLSVSPSSARPDSSAQFEAEMFAEVNRLRAGGGVCPNSSHVFQPTAPLMLHDGLVQAARAHSQDMASRQYFEHQSPEGVGPGPRSRKYGYSGVFTGENIEMGSTTARAAVANWMSSTEGHCMNILDERYHYFGGGYAIAGRPYWTADFGP